MQHTAPHLPPRAMRLSEDVVPSFTVKTRGWNDQVPVAGMTEVVEMQQRLIYRHRSDNRSVVEGLLFLDHTIHQ